MGTRVALLITYRADNARKKTKKDELSAWWKNQNSEAIDPN